MVPLQTSLFLFSISSSSRLIKASLSFSAASQCTFIHTLFHFIPHLSKRIPHIRIAIPTTTKMSSTLKSLFIAALAATVVSAAPLEARTAAAVAKKGLAYNDGSLAVPFGSSVSWAYNWGASRGTLSSKYEFVPMLWSSVDSASSLDLTGAKYVMGYNEPDSKGSEGGSDLTPAAAAASFKSQLTPLASKVKLGSPAVTSWDTTAGLTGGASGLTWLQDFSNACGANNACKISVVPLHWYGTNGQTGAAQAAAFESYIKSAASRIETIFGSALPIWATEFSPLPIGDQQVAEDFLKAALPFLDSYAQVQRYAFVSPTLGDFHSILLLIQSTVRRLHWKLGKQREQSVVCWQCLRLYQLDSDIRDLHGWTMAQSRCIDILHKVRRNEITAPTTLYQMLARVNVSVDA